MARDACNEGKVRLIVPSSIAGQPAERLYEFDAQGPSTASRRLTTLGTRRTVLLGVPAAAAAARVDGIDAAQGASNIVWPLGRPAVERKLLFIAGGATPVPWMSSPCPQALANAS
mmetsp:Transcript_164725/g.523686  ORF Transcript_164725/g.523686 Transcript_164725/m.523686 type:complete len:115 (+) Transcript_164725:191-535(+)